MSVHLLGAKDKVNFAAIIKESLRKPFWYALLISSVINVIMLMMPIYSLQVFDRVMSSGSIETLVALSILAFFMFTLYGIFNALREGMLLKVSGWMEKSLGEKLYHLVINHSSMTGSKIGTQPFNEANVVRNFLTNPAIFSFLDIPWSFVFIFVIYMVSPNIALLVILGTAILFMLTFIKEFRNKPISKETGDLNSQNTRRLDEFIRCSETIDAMGMLPNTYKVWADDQQLVSQRVQDTTFFANNMGSVSKALRMLIQIAITGYGTYLALDKQMTFGGIIACSILAGKAMQPFDALMSVWSNLGNFRESRSKLIAFFDNLNERPKNINLSRPKGEIFLDKISFGKPGPIPGSVIPIIKQIEMKLEASDVVGIIGPSASGKSTLVKLLAGIYKPMSGVVRIDGGDVFHRNREDIGKFLGYLPQTIDLMKGSIRDNIARFDPEAKDEDIIRAAKITGVHEMVLSLPEGYKTVIGDGVVELSGGQKQRLALARAFYMDPSLIILDEPNSNLDEIGERMLIRAVLSAKTLGSTVIMISHKPAIINITDKIAVIKDGNLIDFGNTQEIMNKYARNSANIQGYAKTADDIRKEEELDKQRAEMAVSEIGELAKTYEGNNKLN